MDKPGKLAIHPEEEAHALVRWKLWTQLQRFSRDLIYSTLSRSGGEPFGAPFEIGMPTLTERIVKRFRQRGFFRFESWEQLRRRGQRNKFTRHGAAPHRGPYSVMPHPTSSRGLVARLLRYLRDNRFFLFAAVQPDKEPPAPPPKRRTQRQ
jgi:hypothetical protein